MAKIKYRLTPFHFISLWFLYKVIVGFTVLAKVGDRAELGALLPFMYLGLFLGTLLLDVVMQFIIKGDWKMLYLIQILIIVLIGVRMLKTVHYVG
jgi:hypothetical protein